MDRQEAQRILEAERLKEVETRLELERQRILEQRHNLRRQKVLLAIVSVMMLVAVALRFFSYRQYQQTAVSKVKAIARPLQTFSIPVRTQTAPPDKIPFQSLKLPA